MHNTPTRKLTNAELVNAIEGNRHYRDLMLARMLSHVRAEQICVLRSSRTPELLKTHKTLNTVPNWLNTHPVRGVQIEICDGTTKCVINPGLDATQQRDIIEFVRKWDHNVSNCIHRINVLGAERYNRVQTFPRCLYHPVVDKVRTLMRYFDDRNECRRN